MGGLDEVTQITSSVTLQRSHGTKADAKLAVVTWRDLEAARLALPRKLSRAELARRAGLSESTIGKGLREDRAPRREVRKQVELVLEAVRKMAEAGL